MGSIPTPPTITLKTMNIKEFEALAEEFIRSMDNNAAYLEKSNKFIPD